MESPFCDTEIPTLVLRAVAILFLLLLDCQHLHTPSAIPAPPLLRGVASRIPARFRNN